MEAAFDCERWREDLYFELELGTLKGMFVLYGTACVQYGFLYGMHTNKSIFLLTSPS